MLCCYCRAWSTSFWDVGGRGEDREPVHLVRDSGQAVQTPALPLAQAVSSKSVHFVDHSIAL